VGPDLFAKQPGAEFQTGHVAGEQHDALSVAARSFNVFKSVDFADVRTDVTRMIPGIRDLGDRFGDLTKVGMLEINALVWVQFRKTQFEISPDDASPASHQQPQRSAKPPGSFARRN